jgi:hypothetical protein
MSVLATSMQLNVRESDLDGWRLSQRCSLSGALFLLQYPAEDGFQANFAYISGANSQKVKIPMTGEPLTSQ